MVKIGEPAVSECQVKKKQEKSEFAAAFHWLLI